MCLCERRVVKGEKKVQRREAVQQQAREYDGKEQKTAREQREKERENERQYLLKGFFFAHFCELDKVLMRKTSIHFLKDVKKYSHLLTPSSLLSPMLSLPDQKLHD